MNEIIIIIRISINNDRHTRIRNRVRIFVRNGHNVIGQQQLKQSSSARLYILYIEHGQHQKTMQPCEKRMVRCSIRLFHLQVSRSLQQPRRSCAHQFSNSQTLSPGFV